MTQNRNKVNNTNTNNATTTTNNNSINHLYYSNTTVPKEWIKLSFYEEKLTQAHFSARDQSFRRINNTLSNRLPLTTTHILTIDTPFSERLESNSTTTTTNNNSINHLYYYNITVPKERIKLSFYEEKST